MIYHNIKLHGGFHCSDCISDDEPKGYKYSFSTKLYRVNGVEDDKETEFNFIFFSKNKYEERDLPYYESLINKCDADTLYLYRYMSMYAGSLRNKWEPLTTETNLSVVFTEYMNSFPDMKYITLTINLDESMDKNILLKYNQSWRIYNDIASIDIPADQETYEEFKIFMDTYFIAIKDYIDSETTVEKEKPMIVIEKGPSENVYYCTSCGSIIGEYQNSSDRNLGYDFCPKCTDVNSIYYNRYIPILCIPKSSIGIIESFRRKGFRIENCSCNSISYFCIILKQNTEIVFNCENTKTIKLVTKMMQDDEISKHFIIHIYLNYISITASSSYDLGESLHMLEEFIDNFN